MVRLVLAVLSALSLSTATAHANAIAVSTQPDLVAGVEFQIAAAWSTPAAPSGFVGVTVKPSGPGWTNAWAKPFEVSHAVPTRNNHSPT